MPVSLIIAILGLLTEGIKEAPVVVPFLQKLVTANRGPTPAELEELKDSAPKTHALILAATTPSMQDVMRGPSA